MKDEQVLIDVSDSFRRDGDHEGAYVDIDVQWEPDDLAVSVSPEAVRLMAELIGHEHECDVSIRHEFSEAADLAMTVRGGDVLVIGLAAECTREAAVVIKERIAGALDRECTVLALTGAPGLVQVLRPV